MALKYKISVVVALAFMSLQTFAHKYTNDKLSFIGTKIELTVSDSLQPGYHNAGKYKEKQMVVGITKDKEIFHIGYKLFACDMKSKYPSEVYDFLERYLLELDCLKSEVILKQHLSDDKVQILGGSLSNVNKITDVTPFSISNKDNVCYEIEWKEKNKILLKLLFPIDYQLLLGVRKSEIENTMESMILESKKTIWKLPAAPKVTLQKDGYFRSSPSFAYYLESLNTTEYYERSDRGQYIPVFDDEALDYSVHNLFRGIISENDNYTLNVLQNLYGYKKVAFSSTLSQWIDYCKNNNLRIYVGVSELNEESFRVTVIAQSINLGYNHLMKVIVPKNFMSKKKATFATELYAFIPTSNIKDVYQKNK